MSSHRLSSENDAIGIWIQPRSKEENNTDFELTALAGMYVIPSLPEI